MRWPVVFAQIAVAVSLVAFWFGGGPWGLIVDAFTVFAVALLIGVGWPH